MRRQALSSLVHPRLVLSLGHVSVRHAGASAGHEAQRRQTLYACRGTLPENALEHMDVTQDNRATQTNLKTIASKTTCQQFKCEHSLQDVT